MRKGQSGQQSGDKKGVSAKPVCVYCKGPHNSAHCTVVTDIKTRLDVVKREKLCFNCQGNHKVMHCNCKHHSSLCLPLSQPLRDGPFTTNQNLQDTPPQSSQTLPSMLNPTSNSFTPVQSNGNYTTATQHLCDIKSSPQCLLKTTIALIRVRDNRVPTNILLDEGAQRSFVTETLATQLGAFPHRKETLSISSFGGQGSS